jgi:RNA polymerase sigma-B factor
MTTATAHTTTAESQVVRRESRRHTDEVRARTTRSYLVRALVTTNAAARDRFLKKAVLTNLTVADRLALRYAGRGIPTQDLTQVARLALLKAVHRFDPDAGFDFHSYAVPTIVGELKRHFRDLGWAVRPPRPVQELRPRISSAVSTLSQTLGRTPTRRDVADYLSVKEAAVAEALTADGCFIPASLDRLAGGEVGSDSAWGASLGRDDPDLARLETRLTLSPCLRMLSDRDRLVLRLRFCEGLTQGDIGRRLGVSQMHVSRTLARILLQLKDELAK